MTNKINGIDVSECEYINCCSKKAKCIILQDDILSDSQYCESEPNCYFKQLKRLEQENKELKEKIDIYENSIIANHDRAVGKRLMEVLQALEEIREIVLNFGSTPIGFKVLNIPLNEEDLKTSEGKIFDFYTKLKNKINEVLNDK